MSEPMTEQLENRTDELVKAWLQCPPPEQDGWLV